MANIRILKRSDIEKLLDLPDVIAAVERAYVQKSAGTATLWPMVFYEFNPGKADMDIKSGYLPDEEIYGLKLVSWYGENPAKDLPALYGTTLVFNSNTGAPLGILDAEYITGMRTGAAGAIGAKYLARKDSKNLLMLGTGHQALFQIAASLIALDNIETIRVCNALYPEEAREFCAELPKKLERLILSQYEENSDEYMLYAKKIDVIFEVVEDLPEAVSKSDVIITATPSRKPMLMLDWLKPGTHISCVGADMAGKQEIDENIFSKAKVFADDINQSSNVGEAEIPIARGLFSKEDYAAEIGEVIAGQKTGRSSDEEITVYDSTGIALQDLICSKLALDRAKEKNVGILAEL